MHAAELAANAATSANTASTIVKRDASGNFAAGTATLTSANLSSVVYKDSGANTVTVQAPTTVSTSYTLKWPAAVGSLNQVLTTDASGNLSWTTPASAPVTSVSVTAPITNSGTASAPNITIAKADATHDGYLAQGDWSTFNSKLGTASTFSGDVSGTSSLTDAFNLGFKTNNTTQMTALVGTNNEYISIWMGTCTTSGTTIAVTMTASGANAVFALEFSGVSSTIDTSGTLENGSAYVADTGAITTTNANDLVIAAGVQTASGGTESSFSPTPATGWVDIGGVHYGTTGVAQVLGMCAYRIASATASHRMTWTSTSAATCGAAIVAIKST